MILRRAEPKDTREMWEAHIRSIREICAKDYTPEVVAAWSAFDYSHEHYLKMMAKDLLLVIELNGKVEGLCHAGFPTEDTGEIYGLYFSPNLAGKGMGKKAIQQALEYLKEKSPNRIALRSTRTAKDFYIKMGFVITGPEKMLHIRGVDLAYHPMEMILK